MGRLVNTADINNVLMSEKSNYGVFAVEIEHIISGIVSKCPTIEQEPKTEWIPISRRFPEEDNQYLVCFNDGELELDYYCRGSFSYSGVIAWMPLPEPFFTVSSIISHRKVRNKE